MLVRVVGYVETREKNASSSVSRTTAEAGGAAVLRLEVRRGATRRDKQPSSECMRVGAHWPRAALACSLYDARTDAVHSPKLGRARRVWGVLFSDLG